MLNRTSFKLREWNGVGCEEDSKRYIEKKVKEHSPNQLWCRLI